MSVFAVLLALSADPSPEPPPAKETPAQLAKRIGGLPRAAVEKKLTAADTTALLFKGTLGRAATPEEQAKFLRHIEKSGGVQLEVAQDLAWALINSAEFAKAHKLNAEEAAKSVKTITDEMRNPGRR